MTLVDEDKHQVTLAKFNDYYKIEQVCIFEIDLLFIYFRNLL